MAIEKKSSWIFQTGESEKSRQIDRGFGKLILHQQPDCSLTYFGSFHMYDLGISYTFTSIKKNMESPVIFIRNNILILNGKENKEASAIQSVLR